MFCVSIERGWVDKGKSMLCSVCVLRKVALG